MKIKKNKSQVYKKFLSWFVPFIQITQKHAWLHFLCTPSFCPLLSAARTDHLVITSLPATSSRVWGSLPGVPASTLHPVTFIFSPAFSMSMHWKQRLIMGLLNLKLLIATCYFLNKIHTPCPYILGNHQLAFGELSGASPGYPIFDFTFLTMPSSPWLHAFV